jgi:uncharacterized Zn finger protein (UPF0148 family)
MRVRGERECRECGRRWSYFKTGSVECPTCGSLHSVGTGDREAHTDAPVTLDLHEHRQRFGETTSALPNKGVTKLKRDLRAYVHKRGFVHAGALTELDTTYLAARELLEAVDVYDRLRQPTGDDHAYLLALLAGADNGERPRAAEIPSAMRSARGMATALAVETYREALNTYLTDSPANTSASNYVDAQAGSPHGRAESDTPPTPIPHRSKPRQRTQLDRLRERLRDRTKQITALQGDVDPAAADELMRATRAIYVAVTADDEDAIDRADGHLTNAAPSS